MVDTADVSSPRPAAGSGVAGQVLSWVQTILLSVVAPIMIYNELTDRGVGPVPALLVSGVGPLLDIVITAVRSRRLDEFAIVVLIFLALGVVTSLLFSDPRLLLLKESALTGLLGLVALGSLVVAPRPLMFYFGRRFATGGDPARVEWWNGLWRFEGFRHVQRVITAVWGATLLVEAVVRSVLTYVLSIDTMVVVNGVVPLAVIVLLVVWTTMYGKASQRRAERAGVDLGEPGAPRPA